MSAGEAAFLGAWLRAFLVTWLVELAVLIFALKNWEPSTGRRVAAISFAQLASHPLVWFVIPWLALPRLALLGVSELWAVVVEAAIYRLVFPSLGVGRAGALSLLANAASVIVGLALRHFGML